MNFMTVPQIRDAVLRWQLMKIAIIIYTRGLAAVVSFNKSGNRSNPKANIQICLQLKVSAVMNESIYNLIPPDHKAAVKEPRHISKHDPQGALTGSTFGCSGTTRLPGAGKITYKEGALFGPPKALNSIATINKTKAIEDDDYRLQYQTRRKTPLIAKGDTPVVGLRSNKNFITANAVEAILQVPRVIQSNELNYLKKEDYGKVPEYLTKVKDEIQRENVMIDKYVKHQLGEVEREPDQYDELSDNERQHLVSQLKEKWDHVNSQYQKITHLVRLDTTGQVRRKEQLETELTSLETDIEYLSRAGSLLVKH